MSGVIPYSSVGTLHRDLAKRVKLKEFTFWESLMIIIFLDGDIVKSSGKIGTIVDVEYGENSRQNMYSVSFDDGTSIVCFREHFIIL